MNKLITLIFGILFIEYYCLCQHVVPSTYMIDIDSNEYTLRQDFSDNDVLVVFAYWTSCGWSIKAIPQVKELMNKYNSKNIEFIGLVNTSLEKNELDSFILANELNFLHFKRSENYSLVNYFFTGQQIMIGYPTIFVLNMNNARVSFHQGYNDHLADTISNFIDNELSTVNTNPLLVNYNSGDLIIFPNPTMHYIYLRNLPDKNVESYITLYSLNGKEILTKKIKSECNAVEIDIEGFKSGSYILEYRSKNHVIRETIIIKE